MERNGRTGEEELQEDSSETEDINYRVICKYCGNALRRLARQGFFQTKVYSRFGYFPWECPLCREPMMVKQQHRYKTESAPGPRAAAARPVEPARVEPVLNGAVNRAINGARNGMRTGRVNGTGPIANGLRIEPSQAMEPSVVRHAPKGYWDDDAGQVKTSVPAAAKLAKVTAEAEKMEPIAVPMGVREVEAAEPIELEPAGSEPFSLKPAPAKRSTAKPRAKKAGTGKTRAKRAAANGPKVESDRATGPTEAGSGAEG